MIKEQLKKLFKRNKSQQPEFRYERTLKPDEVGPFIKSVEKSVP